MLTKWEIGRIKYLVSQADKGTYVGLNKSDAELLTKLYKDYKEQHDWEEVLSEVREQLKDGKVQT